MKFKIKFYSRMRSEIIERIVDADNEYDANKAIKIRYLSDKIISIIKLN